ncbi:hypothetical protein ACFRQM_26940 [Streptomyces sp. NPDC056831]|uniref:hypothetical protein n=1 Tax=Streptomyces sp. NPDC056831 TaxID=3345954 RepID=UPI0036C80520
MQNTTTPIPLSSQLATQYSHTPEAAPELVAYLATHPGPLAAADAIVRTADGRIDKSMTKPAPRTAAADDENGRGLTVIAALTETTGTDTFGWGKRTWAGQ